MVQSGSGRLPLEWFRDRLATLATMHQKEIAIAPLLKENLGLQVTVPHGFDSDRLGTFTREVKRYGTQLEAARQKAIVGMELTGHAIGIASEGSFGPHPAMPFLPSNREIVLLIDRGNDLEVIGEAISTETNFSHKQVTNLEEAKTFARKAKFPQHGLVVIANADANGITKDKDLIIKGITSEAQLIDAVQWALKQADRVHIETDMRAMHNPTRMKIIAQATEDLIAKLQKTCPNCNTPGFSVADRLPGLPCGLCGTPTDLTRSIVYRCQKCQHREEVLFPNGVETADPGQCPYCNP
ncbi:hypothetical protein NDA02_05245 [Leptolyngbya sp. ST-U4]